MKKHISLLLCWAALTLGSGAWAQTPRERIQDEPEYSGCYYRSYPVPSAPSAIHAPEGFHPFYISHYGRHGSRWVSDQKVYDRTRKWMSQAAADDALTAKGKQLLAELQMIWEDARDRAGDLSPKGAAEHKGIARRMYLNYPEIFAGKAKVNCISTLSPRCILSMAASNEALKELNPQLDIRRESSKRHTHYMHNYEYTDDIYLASEAAGDSLIRAWVRPDRFLEALFKEPSYIRENLEDPAEAMTDLFHLASDMQCVDYLHIDLYKYFTDEELYQLWRGLNGHTYLTEGPSWRYGDLIMANAKNLVMDFVTKADDVISGKSRDAATLRYGHESNIVPFMALTGVQAVAVRTTAEAAEKCWNSSEICPMATNIQFVFFRNRTGQVKVRVLHNEHDAVLPVAGGPFYDWTDLRQHLLEKADKTGLGNRK